jgi:hypothetical protein
VANGADVTVKMQVGRSAAPGVWQYMGIGMDNLRVVALEAGDATGDLAVDGSDLNVWNDNKFDASESKTWTQGDWNGDAAVDGSDLNAWNDAKFSTYDLIAPETTDVADIVYDNTTGELKLVVTSATDAVEAAILIATDEMNVVSADATGLPPHPFGFQSWDYQYFKGKLQYTDGGLNLGDGADAALGEYTLAVLELGLTEADFGEAEYGSTAGTQFTEVTIVPEPMTMSLLAVGGLGVLIRRKRR